MTMFDPQPTDHGAGADPALQTAWAPAAPEHENVGRGLAAAGGLLVLGVGLTVAVWELGFIASITSLLMAAGAVFAYTKAAGTAPRKGVGALVVLIVVVIVLTFFVLVGWDAAKAYDKIGGAAQTGMGKSDFVVTALTTGSVLSSYAKDMLLFFVLAGLGVFSTLRQTLAGGRV